MVNACEASTDPRVVCHDRRGSNEGAGTCISRAATYEEAYSTFRWEVPARFNIARAICDDHAARTPDAPALLYEQADGQLRAWSFAEIQAAANRFANVLGAFGVAPWHHRRHPPAAMPGKPDRARRHPEARRHRPADVQPVRAGRHRLSPGRQRRPRADLDARSAGAQCRGAARHRHAPAGRQRRRCGACKRAGFLAAGRARISARRNRRHRPGRSGAADLHLGDHRQPEGRAACRPRAARPPAGRDACRTISSRSRAIASGRRPTGPGPAACSTCCGRRSTTAWRWSARCATKFDPEWAFAFMARHGIRNIFMPPTALAPDAPGARPARRGTPTRCARSAPAARSWART